jgi:mutator protein MutT
MKRGVDYIGVAVGAMILNDKGEVLLCKRSQRAYNERGCWEVPGGAVEFGEKLEDAIRREIREELGVEIELIEQFPAADHIIPGDKQHWVPTTFLAKLMPGNTPKIMEPIKCDALDWFSIDRLPTPLSLITQYDVQYYRKRFHT